MSFQMVPLSLPIPQERQNKGEDDPYGSFHNCLILAWVSNCIYVVEPLCTDRYAR